MIELRYTIYSLNNWSLLSIYCSRLLLIDPRSPILISWDLAVCSSADILELHILRPFRLHEAYLAHEPRGHNIQEPRQDHIWVASAYSSRGSECIAIFPREAATPKFQHLWMLSKALSHSHTLHNVQLLVSRYTPRGTWIALRYLFYSTSWILSPLIITLKDHVSWLHSLSYLPLARSTSFFSLPLFHLYIWWLRTKWVHCVWTH